MSLDYPNRNDWMRVRATPRRADRVLWNKGTFTAGRNAEKRSTKYRMHLLANRRLRQRRQVSPL